MTEEGEVEEEEHPEAEAEAVVEASLHFTTQDSWNPVPLHMLYGSCLLALSLP